MSLSKNECQQNTFNLGFCFIAIILVVFNSVWIHLAAGKVLICLPSLQPLPGFIGDVVFMQMKQFTDSRANIWNLCGVGWCCTTHEGSRVAHQPWTKLGVALTENNNRISGVHARLSSNCPWEPSADRRLLSCRAVRYRFMSWSSISLLQTAACRSRGHGCCRGGGGAPRLDANYVWVRLRSSIKLRYFQQGINTWYKAMSRPCQKHRCHVLFSYPLVIIVLPVCFLNVWKYLVSFVFHLFVCVFQGWDIFDLARQAPHRVKIITQFDLSGTQRQDSFCSVQTLKRCSVYRPLGPCKLGS